MALLGYYVVVLKKSKTLYIYTLFEERLDYSYLLEFMCPGNKNYCTIINNNLMLLNTDHLQAYRYFHLLFLAWLDDIKFQILFVLIKQNLDCIDSPHICPQQYVLYYSLVYFSIFRKISLTPLIAWRNKATVFSHSDFKTNRFIWYFFFLVFVWKIFLFGQKFRLDCHSRI